MAYNTFIGSAADVEEDESKKGGREGNRVRGREWEKKEENGRNGRREEKRGRERGREEGKKGASRCYGQLTRLLLLVANCTLNMQ